MGAASNTRMAKEVLFWPGIGKDIAEICNSCEECPKYQQCAPKKPMRSLPIPSMPWHIVSQDLFKYDKRDSCNCLPLLRLDRSRFSLINCTKAHFSRHGIPEICHTDNGPQFVSNNFRKFTQSYGF